MHWTALSVSGIGGRLLYAAVFAILLALLLSPLLIETVPPLLDYPIHLARSHIVAEHADNPTLQEIYDISWRPIPNLAGDILMFFLEEFVETEVAGRIMLGACLALTVAGTILLYRVLHQEWSYWPFMAFLFAYHGAITAGFVNYSIGIALLPFALSASISCSTWRHGLSLAIDCLMALMLLFCHVLAVGIFAVYLTSYYFLFPLINRSFRSRLDIVTAIFRSVTPFIIPAALYMAYSLSEVVVRDEPNVVGSWDLLSKMRGIAMPVIGGNLTIDILFALFVGLVLIYCVMSRHFIDIRKDIAIGSSLIVLIFLILPGEILDAAFIADRLTIAAALVGLAVIKIDRMERRLFIALACGLIVLVAARAISLSADWQESDRYYRRLALSTEKIDPGSSVLIVSPLTHHGGKGVAFWIRHRLQNPNWQYALINLPSLHGLPALLLAQRSTFSQLHFVWSDKQILSLSQPFQHLDYGDGGVSTWAPDSVFSQSREEVRIAERFADFDYVLVLYSQLIDDDMIERIREMPVVYSDEGIMLIENRWSKSWLDRSKTLSTLD